MSIPGPKENLVPGQEYDINKMFYRDYMIEYFDEKVVLNIDLLNNSKEYIEKILDKELMIGKIKFEAGKDFDAKKVEKYAKCELVETYYHCLETFMRLFIAHASFQPCPLIEIVSITPHDYRKKVNQIISSNFDNLNNKYDGDDTILLVFFGSRKNSTSITERQLKNLKEWIVFCAKELKKMDEYNSFKHGLSMFAGYGAIKVSNPNTGNVVFEKEGDAIHILENKNCNTRYKFNQKNIFVEYDFKVTLTIFFNELIKNMIQVGCYRYVQHDENSKLIATHLTEFNYFELMDLFYKEGDLGAKLDSYSIPLIYEDDLENQLEDNNDENRC